MRNKDIEEATNLLLYLPRAMRTSLDREVFKPPLKLINQELAPHHMIILKVIQDTGDPTITEIAQEAMISKAQMTHSVDKLTSLDLIERVPDSNDRRKTAIVLTEKGNETVNVFEKALKKQMTEKLSWLQDDDLKKFLGALKTMVETVEKLR